VYRLSDRTPCPSVGIAAEQDLLIRCARLALGQDVDVNPDIDTSVDWDRFVDLAAAQAWRH